MKILGDTTLVFIYVVAAIAALMALFTIDTSAYIDGLVQGVNLEDRYAYLLMYAGWFVKGLFMLTIFGLCLFFTWRRAGPKSLTNQNLADEVFKLHNKKVKIELIGYSLGFANPIQLRLEEQPWNDLDVTIYVMEKDTILGAFKEKKSLKHRVDVISERLGEWKALKRQNKIGSLTENRVGDLMPFAAVVIDGTRLFVSNYKWRVVNGRLSLQKVPAPERLFYEISNVGGAYETVMAVINTFRRHG